MLPVAMTMAWQTKWDAPFKYECAGNTPLMKMKSIHDNHKEDRVFEFGVSTVSEINYEWGWSCDYGSPSTSHFFTAPPPPCLFNFFKT